MEELHTWSTKVAEDVAPDEVALAPYWLDAYLEGGQSRAELLAGSGSVLGGFSAADVASIMPAVYQAVASAAPVVLVALGSPVLGDFLSAVKNAIGLAELHEQRRGASAAPRSAIPAHEHYTPLRRVLDALDVELRRAGLPPARCESVALRVTRRLLEHPGEAKRVTQALSRS